MSRYVTSATGERGNRLGIWLLAALFLATAIPGSAAASARPSESREYSQRFGVTVERAEEVLQIQASGAEADIVGQLEDRLGSRYAGVWFDNQRGEFVVPTLDGGGHKAVAAELAKGGLKGSNYRAPSVQASWGALEAAQERLNHALSTAMREAYVRTSIDPRTNSVVVLETEGASDAVSTKVREQAQAAKVPVEVRTKDVEKLSTMPAACGIDSTSYNCDAPLRGGVELAEEGSVASCTVGFKATGISTGDRFVLSAGHCAINPFVEKWAALGPQGTEHFLGTTEKAYWGTGGYDVVKIRANGSKHWDTPVWPTQVIEWDEPTATMINSERPITSESNSYVGQFACLTGITTGSDCGYVKEVDITVSGNFKNLDVVVNHLSEIYDVSNAPGNSGGPVFAGNSALGLVSFSDAELPWDHNAALYTEITEDTDLLGVTVAPRTGPKTPASPDQDDNTPGPRAVAQPDGTIDTFYRDGSGNLGHNWYDTGEAGWQSGELPGALATSGVPHAVTQPDGTIDVFFRTPSGELGHTWKGSGPGGEWSSANLPGSVASDPHAVAQTDGTIDVFYRTPSGGLGHNWYDTGEAGWQYGTLPGSLGSDPYLVSQPNGTIDVFFRTPSGALGHTWKGAGAGSEWTSANLPGSVASDPHAVAQTDGTVDVFYRTPSGGLGHNWYDTGGAGWQFNTLAGSVGSAPHIVAQSDGTIDVFFRTPSGELGHTWKSSGPSGEWTSANLPGSVASEPHAVAQPDGTVDVFYRTPSGGLGHNWYDTGEAGWQYGTLGGSVASDPHPVAQSDGTIDVFFRTPSGELGHTWKSSGPSGEWTSANLPGTVAARPPLASTEAATGVSFNEATLKGTVNPEGSVTSYYFEYGTTTSYGSKKPVAGESTGPEAAALSVSQTPTGLAEGTTYHYRVVATSPEGTAYGADKTFKTNSLGTTETTLSVTQVLNGQPGYVTVSGSVKAGSYSLTGQKVKIKYEKETSAGVWTLMNTIERELNAAGTYGYENLEVSQANWRAVAQFQGGATLASSSSSYQAFHVGLGYQLVFAHSSKCVDVQNGSTSNGALIQQWDCLAPATHLNQVFQLVPVGSPWFQIRNINSGRCIDVIGASTANGGWLQQWNCATVGQQKFQLAQPSGGTVALQVAHTGKCVDVNSSSTTSGVILQQWDCQWGNNQRVTFQSVG
jgi:hypothetical protein